MANVKKFTIRADVPFHCYENSDLMSIIGFLTCPTVGGEVEWGPVLGSYPNAHGGRTEWYQLTLSGREALSFGWFDGLRDALRAVGAHIRDFEVQDVEAGDSYDERTAQSRV